MGYERGGRTHPREPTPRVDGSPGNEPAAEPKPALKLRKERGELEHLRETHGAAKDARNERPAAQECRN